MPKKSANPGHHVNVHSGKGLLHGRHPMGYYKRRHRRLWGGRERKVSAQLQARHRLTRDLTLLAITFVATLLALAVLA